MIPFQHGVFATAAGAVAGFEAIATVTATGGETSLTFSSIPQGYASLQIRGIFRGNFSTASTGQLEVRVNGSGTLSNYAIHELIGNGSSLSALGYSSGSVNGIWAGQYTGSYYSANMYSATVIDLQDYASTTHNKTVRAFSGADYNTATTNAVVTLSSGVYLQTTAVTSVQLYDGYGSGFAAGTTFALYGVKAAA